MNNRQSWKHEDGQSFFDPTVSQAPGPKSSMTQGWDKARQFHQDLSLDLPPSFWQFGQSSSSKFWMDGLQTILNEGFSFREKVTAKLDWLTQDFRQVLSCSGRKRCRSHRRGGSMSRCCRWLDVDVAQARCRQNWAATFWSEPHSDFWLCQGREYLLKWSAFNGMKNFTAILHLSRSK